MVLNFSRREIIQTAKVLDSGFRAGKKIELITGTLLGKTPTEIIKEIVCYFLSRSILHFLLFVIAGFIAEAGTL